MLEQMEKLKIQNGGKIPPPRDTEVKKRHSINLRHLETCL
jgi:hypothetical protein